MQSEGADQLELWRMFLVEEMNKRHMNQRQLAIKADIAPSIISRWVTKRNGADAISAQRIADALGLHPDLVFEKAGIPLAKPLPPGYGETLRLESLVKRLAWRDHPEWFVVVELLLRGLLELQEGMTEPLQVQAEDKPTDPPLLRADDV